MISDYYDYVREKYLHNVTLDLHTGGRTTTQTSSLMKNATNVVHELKVVHEGSKTPITLISLLVGVSILGKIFFFTKIVWAHYDITGCIHYAKDWMSSL